MTGGNMAVTNQTILTKIDSNEKILNQLQASLDLHIRMQEEGDKMLKEHDKVLIRGNGQPSLVDEIRNLKAFVGTLKFWFQVIGIAFIGQFVAIFVGTTIVIIQVLPILNKWVSIFPQVVK